MERWSPGLKVVQYYGSQDERKEMRMGWRNGDLDDVDVLLTTYSLICSTPEERRLFRVMPLNYVVFDEAHMLKNMSSIRYENLVRINVRALSTCVYMHIYIGCLSQRSAYFFFFFLSDLRTEKLRIIL